MSIFKEVEKTYRGSRIIGINKIFHPANREWESINLDIQSEEELIIFLLGYNKYEVSHLSLNIETNRGSIIEEAYSLKELINDCLVNSNK